MESSRYFRLGISGLFHPSTGHIECFRDQFAGHSRGYLYPPGTLVSRRNFHITERYRAEMVNAVSLEANLKVPAERLWGAIKDSRNLLPKILPSQFKSVEVIEGDGYAVGSVRLINYGEGIPGLTYAKEKIEAVDEANKTLEYSVVEGEVLKVYKTFKPSLKVIEVADANSSVIKWSVAFEPVSAEAPPPEFLKEIAFNTFKALESYLLSAKAPA